MDWLNEIWGQVANYISVPYLLSFIFLSFFVKKYFGKKLKTLLKWKTVYTVLIFATVLAIPFLIWTEISWIQIVFSYSIGTSLHELIFKYIEKLFVK